jgi:hypothetical protein
MSILSSSGAGRIAVINDWIDNLYSGMYGTIKPARKITSDEKINFLSPYIHIEDEHLEFPSYIKFGNCVNSEMHYGKNIYKLDNYQMPSLAYTSFISLDKTISDRTFNNVNYLYLEATDFSKPLLQNVTLNFYPELIDKINKCNKHFHTHNNENLIIHNDKGRDCYFNDYYDNCIRNFKTNIPINLKIEAKLKNISHIHFIDKMKDSINSILETIDKDKVFNSITIEFEEYYATHIMNAVSYYTLRCEKENAWYIIEESSAVF